MHIGRSATQYLFSKKLFHFNATRIFREGKVPLEAPRKPSKHAINFLEWPRNCQ